MVAPAAAAVPSAGGATTNDAGALQAVSVSIPEIQENTSGGTATPFAGQEVTTTGTVTAIDGNGFHIQDGTGEYSGVYVFTGGENPVSVGDTVDVTGTATEFFGLTEVDVTTENGSVSVTGSAEVPDPVVLSTDEAGQEAYEGVLVRVEDVEVTQAPDSNGNWAVDDGSGSVVISPTTAGASATPSEAGATADAVVGPLAFSFGEYKIRPTSIENLQAPSDDGGSDDDADVTGPTLTLLTYNDIQTAASNPTAMGRLQGAIDQREAAIDNPTVVIGGGDQVSPSSLSPVSNWTVPIRALNLLDPAAEVIGNHDLDFGFEAVTDFTAESEFPWLVANIQRTGTDGENIPGTEDYTIVERDGIRVGIIGLVDGAVEPKTAVDFAEEGYEVTDFVDVGTELATELKTEENVDVVVAAAHIGIPESQELAQASDDIDAIVVGDDEREYPPQVTSGTVIVEAEARAAFLGEVNLTVGEDAVAFESGRLIALEENDAIPVDQTMFDLINDSRGRFLSEVAGTTEVPLDSTFANYDEDTQWGNIITDGFLSRTGAQVAITNAGGIRGGFVIEPGDVTFDDVYTSLPFGNTLVTKEMDGEKLYELLASQAGPLTADFGAEAAIQVSGVTYEYVDRPGVEDPVMEVFVQGEPLRMDRNYTVTVNSFMAGWTFEERYGWNMADLPTVDEDLTLYGTAALEQVQAVSPITEDTAAGDRIRRVTRVAGESAVEVDGDTATLTYEVPDAVGSVEADTFHVDNEVGEELAATDATLSGDSLTVEFDADEFAALEDASDTLELYGTYNDTEFDSQRNGFDQSVLNGEVIEEGSVINVIWGDDRRLSDGELQTAIDYWVSGDPVPGTDGTVVSDRLLSIVIQKWVTAGS